jgi:hypothetical protein
VIVQILPPPMNTLCIIFQLLRGRVSGFVVVKQEKNLSKRILSVFINLKKVIFTEPQAR